jgi:hypothetical protein
MLTHTLVNPFEVDNAPTPETLMGKQLKLLPPSGIPPPVALNVWEKTYKRDEKVNTAVSKNFFISSLSKEFVTIKSI